MARQNSKLASPEERILRERYPSTYRESKHDKAPGRMMLDPERERVLRNLARTYPSMVHEVFGDKTK